MSRDFLFTFFHGYNPHAAPYWCAEGIFAYGFDFAETHVGKNSFFALTYGSFRRVSHIKMEGKLKY